MECKPRRYGDSTSPLSRLSQQVGDYKYDLAAGRAAGIATVHVDIGTGTWPELTDVYVKSLMDLHEMLDPPAP